MSFLYPAKDDPKRAARRPMLAFILVTLAVGAAASIFSKPAIPTWYAGLVHPLLTPPNWLFAPAWTALYVLMALAAWRVWRVAGTVSREILAYAIQLALNFGWCWIFFGLQRIGPALVEILVLDLAILVTTILFFRRDRLAGLLFLPYLGWTLYTSLLNYDLARLNP
jgi:tryptophan-rich sensory protein